MRHVVIIYGVQETGSGEILTDKQRQSWPLLLDMSYYIALMTICEDEMSPFLQRLS
jgi:hypothetical protein